MHGGRKRKQRIKWQQGLAVLLLVFDLFLENSLTAYADASADMTDKVCKGVVQIAAVYTRSGRGLTAGTGTGFGVGQAGKDTNVFVTNWHVVTDENGKVCDEVYIMLDNADLWDDSTLVRCKVLYTTTGYPDFAIIQAIEEVKGLKALPLLRSESVKKGTAIYAMGYPEATNFGKSHSTIDDITVTQGVISKFIELQEVDTKCVVHDAHINHGNSGGPLVTIDGAVIGINTYTMNVDDNYSYAVYIDYAMEALDNLGIPYDVYGEEKSEEDTSAQEKDISDKKTQEEESQDKNETDDNKEISDIREQDNSFVWLLVGAGVLVIGGIAFVLFRKSNSGRRSFSGYSLLTPDGRTVPVPAGGLSIGRDPSNQICLPPDTKAVSRQHCSLSVGNGVLILTDLNSSYGTFVDGNRVNAHTPVILQKGMSFYLGEAVNRFTVK